MHDAWDTIVETPPTCNQLKFNTCKAKFSSLWTNPKTKTWTYNHQAPPHLFLDFLKQIEHPRTSHFPRVHAKIWTLTSLSSLFLLRKVLGSSLESPSQVHRFTHPKERQNPTPKVFPLSHFFWLHQTESPALFLLSFFFVFVFFSLCSHTAGSSLSPKNSSFFKEEI